MVLGFEYRGIPRPNFTGVDRGREWPIQCLRGPGHEVKHGLPGRSWGHPPLRAAASCCGPPERGQDSGRIHHSTGSAGASRSAPGTGHLVFAFVIFFNGLLRALARYLFIDTLKRLYFFYQTTKNLCKSTGCTGSVTHEHDGFSTQL